MALILSMIHRLKVSRAGDDEDFGGPLQALGKGVDQTKEQVMEQHRRPSRV